MPPARLLSIAALAATLALLAPTPARACTVSATGVAFGAYDPTSPAPDDGTGTVSLACPPSVSAPVVSLGSGLSGLIGSRQMTSGSSNLSYNLYTNAARTLIWGNGLGGSLTVTLTGGTVSSGTRTFSRTVYGRIPAGQNVAAGTYSDTIVVTVTF